MPAAATPGDRCELSACPKPNQANILSSFPHHYRGEGRRFLNQALHSYHQRHLLKCRSPAPTPAPRCTDAECLAGELRNPTLQKGLPGDADNLSCLASGKPGCRGQQSRTGTPLSLGSWQCDRMGEGWTQIRSIARNKAMVTALCLHHPGAGAGLRAFQTLHLWLPFYRWGD